MGSSAQPPLVELDGVGKFYPPTTHALHNVDLRLHSGETVAIVGPSGSGKSTLLAILGLFDTPTEGVYRIAGEDTAALGDEQRTLLRRQYIGFVFQSFHLIPHLTAFENVQLSLSLTAGSAAKRTDETRMALERVGLAHRMSARPHTMSGGEQQRVAIARAAVRRPRLLLCDEPTGNLDSATTASIMELLFDAQRDDGVLVVVTHDLDIARQCGRIVTILDGALSEDAFTAD